MKQQREKVVQAQGCALLRSIGASVYVLGTRRPRGDHQGTCQTAGIADVIAFLPTPPRPPRPQFAAATVLFWEVKAAGGRASADQRTFETACLATATPYVRGGLDALFHFLIRGGWLLPDRVAHYRVPPETVTP